MNNLYPLTSTIPGQANGSSAPSAGGGGTAVQTVASTGQSDIPASNQPQGGFLGAGGMQPMVMILLMFGVFYLLLIRPQQKKAKEHQKMLDAIGKGAEIITNGGLIGKIISVKGKILTVEVADKVRVKILRSQIAGLFDSAAYAADSKNKSDSKLEKK